MRTAQPRCDILVHTHTWVEYIEKMCLPGVTRVPIHRTTKVSSSPISHARTSSRNATAHALAQMPLSGKKRARSDGVEDEPLADVARSLAIVTSAYVAIDGYDIARTAKRQQREAGIYIDGIQYGEVNPEAFATALSWCAPRAGETFVDLGSGSGKAVLTAALLHPLASATGIEILEPLHKAAMRAHEAVLAADARALRTPEVRFECGDALSHPWTDCDLVFVSLTCFTDEMVERVAADAQRLRSGSRLLCTSRALETGSALRLLRREPIKYGRGMLTFLAYERV